MKHSFPHSVDADIALLLEGTYPYVRGGVSTWIHQMLLAYPEYRFALIFLGSHPDDYDKPYYTFPSNVVHFEEHFLHTPPQHHEKPHAVESDHSLFSIVQEFHKDLKTSYQDSSSFIDMTKILIKDKGINEQQFLHSHLAWEHICQSYTNYCTDPSFVDYFWTIRSMHRPLWILRDIAKNLLSVKVCHTISTGYAGMLGAMISQTRNLPLILTEHGIYTKERKIDLSQTEWIADNRNIFQRDSHDVGYFRELWIKFFEHLGKFCYKSSTIITTLYEANRQRQIEDGASPQKTRVIPNGIDIERFRPLRSQRSHTIPHVVCLIGRVVPIKDVKTFIRSLRIIVSHIPDIQGWIAGPQEEDPTYVQECYNLIESLNLTNHVSFLGFQKIDDLLPQVGLLALTSISEALPLVILEAAAAGVPCVVTDVGSCRELIQGSTQEDKQIGESGRIVPIADPESFASCVIELFSNPLQWQQAQQVGIERVEKFYTQTLMFDRYKEMYEEVLHGRNRV